jgi:hypothetical protein
MAQCKFFVAGYCMRGDTCRYSHETTPGISDPASAPPPALCDVAKSNASKRVPSRISQGGLWREQRVLMPADGYVHDVSPPNILQSTQPLPQSALVFRTRGSDLARPTPDSRSQVPCHHYARGNCRNGDTCPYSHLDRGDKCEQKVEAASDPEVLPFQNIPDFSYHLYM